MKVFVQFCMLLLAVALPSANAALRTTDLQFVEKHCFECHDSEVKKGGLDLTALKFDPANSTNFSIWALVHDRVRNGEMPPKKKARPEPAELEEFTKSLSSSLIAAERTRRCCGERGEEPPQRIREPSDPPHDESPVWGSRARMSSA